MFLGIEIGGTKLQLGLGKGDGTLATLWRGRVDVAAGSDGIRKQLVGAVAELVGRASLSREQILGVGIGFGGPVDDRTATVITSHQIQGWNNFPLAAWVTELLGWPTVLGNDADVAGLAEAISGAGQGHSPLFYITIGSGIGGGLIINDDIFRGCGRGAAEIGHVRVRVNSIYGPQLCPLEQVASGWAIQERARAEMGKTGGLLHELSRGDPQRLTAEHVAQAAMANDPLATSILDRAWDGLAEAIVHVITLLCPRRFVIGGGVSLMGERLLLEPLRKRVAALAFPPFGNEYDIVPAALGEEVVVHGAIALARSRLLPQALQI
jgi:glucokinase